MKRFSVILLCVIIVLSALCLTPVSAAAVIWDGSSVSASLAGAGSSADPYQITSGADLEFLRREINSGNVLYSSAYYKQTCDIDLSGYIIEPIGPTNTAGAFFNGVYNGGGFTVSNFVINTNAKYAGLFGYIAGGFIEGLKVAGASVSSSSGESSSAVGIIAGYINTGSSVSACSTAADCYVEALNTARVGGIVGWNYSSTIDKCLNRATVVYSGASTPSAGGITSTIGKDDAVISGCINLGTVLVQASAESANIKFGGIVGIGGGSSGVNDVKDCYNAGTVASAFEFATGTVGAGGICGNNNKVQTTFSDCYNVGAVTVASGKFNEGKNLIGSITGYAPADSTDPSVACYSLTQTGVKAIGDPEAAGLSLVSALSDSIKKSDNSSVKLSDALAAIDAAVASALGVTCDWSGSSYDLEAGAADVAAALEAQTKHIAIIDSAPKPGETKPTGTTPTEPVTTASTPVTTPSVTEPPAVQTTAEGKSTTAPTADTVPPAASTTAAEGEKKGCGSSLGAGALILTAVLGAAYAVKRKRN